MNVFEYDTFTFVAGENLNTDTKGTGHIYKAVAIDDGKIAANGNEAMGILQRATAQASEHTQLAYAGKMKFTAALSMGAGARLTITTSGYTTLAGSGDPIVGKSIDACDSGMIGRGIFDFANGILIA